MDRESRRFGLGDALKRKVNPARIPIEQKESVRWLENLKRSTRSPSDPPRCLHIGDREGDVFELLRAVEEAETRSLVRTCVDRLAGLGGTTNSGTMGREPIRGEHEVEVQDDRGRVSTAEVHLRYRRLTAHPPIGEQGRNPALSLAAIQAHERGTPSGRGPILWKLLTNGPVDDPPSAIEKPDRYSQRWEPETFHEVLKSGYQAEQSKLRTAERLPDLLAAPCIVGRRVFWLTTVDRATPEAPPEVALTKAEVEILDGLARGVKPPPKPAAAHYPVAIARPGGDLARAKGPPPGTMVIWRG